MKNTRRAFRASRRNATYDALETARKCGNRRAEEYLLAQMHVATPAVKVSAAPLSR